MTVMTTAADTGAADIDAAMKAGDHAALVSALVRTARDVGLVPCEDFGFMFANQLGGGMERGFPLVEGRHGKRRLCLARGAH